MTPELKQEHLTIKELIAFMNVNGLSHKEFADILGITVQGIVLMLEGKRNITKPTTRLIRMFQKYPQLIREFGRC